MPAEPAGRGVTLARDGVALMTILRPSPSPGPAPAKRPEDKLPPDPARELKTYLDRITGADFRVEEAAEGARGIYVGRAADFPWLGLDGSVAPLGPEGFVARSGVTGDVGGDGASLYLVGNASAGVAHAVTTFLMELGCRWFFPGREWEVVPRLTTVEGCWDLTERPAFPIQRKIWYGFGAYRKNKEDKREWDRRNRMGGAVAVTIGHTWHGLDPKKDLAAHPEWFALVKGERKPTKPCYSHPEVVKRATAAAVERAASGAKMISMTPPDGLGYCECERCKRAAGGGDTYWEKGSLFAKRPDGTVVNVTSETLFAMVSEVARAVAAEHPDTLIGCYAYSAYSHPPSFKLHPNVFLQTTTAYRRTPMGLLEQLEAFKRLGVRSGIRGYWDVYQWSYDRPGLMKWDRKLRGAPPQPDGMVPAKLQKELRAYAAAGVGSVNAEMSCNWGPRGLAYYVGARLLWDPDEDVAALVQDFYEKAFGPAASAMERYYARWYGHTVAADPGSAPVPLEFGREALAAAYRDLDEAAKLVRDDPSYRARVDHLRMYAHYLTLRLRLEDAAKTDDRDAIVEAIRNETVFGARLMDTNMVHARPLIGKAFHRRFRKWQKFLQGMPEGAEKAGWGKGFRKPRSDVPTREEIERLWVEDKRYLGL